MSAYTTIRAVANLYEQTRDMEGYDEPENAACIQCGCETSRGVMDTIEPRCQACTVSSLAASTITLMKRHWEKLSDSEKLSFADLFEECEKHVQP